jgi:MFS family permease
MGEGVAFPAIHSMIARWIPPVERARAVAIVISACYLGTILPIASAPTIILRIGWQFVFYLFGSLGFFWVLGWHYLCSGHPNHHKTIHPSELSYIQSSLDKTSEEMEKEKKNATPWRAIALSPAVWAIMINQFCSSYAFYVLLSWLPTYFEEYFGIDMQELSFYGVLPYLVQGLFGMVSGWIGDKLITKGLSVEASRKILQIAGLLIPAIFFTVLAFGRITNQFLGVALVSLALGSGTLTLAGVSVNHLDIAPKYSGVVFAVGNTMGTVAGIVGTPLSGAIVQITGSWNWVFGTMVVASIIGIVSWFFMAKGKPVIH